MSEVFEIHLPKSEFKIKIGDKIYTMKDSASVRTMLYELLEPLGKLSSGEGVSKKVIDKIHSTIKMSFGDKDGGELIAMYIDDPVPLGFVISNMYGILMRETARVNDVIMKSATGDSGFVDTINGMGEQIVNKVMDMLQPSPNLDKNVDD